MNDEPRSTKEDFTPQLRTMQIIAAALLGGVVAFATILLTSVQGGNKPLEVMGITALCFAALSAVLGFVVPGKTGSTSQASSTREFLGVYQTRLIVRLAILEGAAFFNLVAFQSGNNWLSLVAAGLLALLMLASFPTQGKLIDWLRTERQLAMLGDSLPD